MGNLGQMTILIGREPGQSRLAVAVKVNGQVKQGLVGQPGSVPKTVSRFKPLDNSAHCRIDVDSSGVMTVTNMNPNNVTYVDGVEVSSKRISGQSAVALGAARYPLSVSTVLDAAQKIAGAAPQPQGGGNVPPKQPQQPTVSICHLKDIWEEYEKALEDIQRRNQDRAKRRTLPMVIGSASSLAAILASQIEEMSDKTLWITIPVAVVSFSIFVKNYTEKDTSIEDKKAATDRLIDKYVCPAKGCHHFMGYQPYKILRQNKKCQYCGALFTED